MRAPLRPLQLNAAKNVRIPVLGSLVCWQSARALSLSSLQRREWSTPLAKTISDAITTTGPISIAAYMRQCLTAPEGGYYTTYRDGKAQDDPFGQKGDFVTSPEISQVFGELVGIWFVAEWMAQGKPTSGIDIIELGPGRGTLLDDMLRTLRNFGGFMSAVQSIHLVEASPALRQRQKRLLCKPDAEFEKTDSGLQCTSKYSNIPITWCEDLQSVPKGPSTMPLIIAHEFFDALPIHAFQSVAPRADATAPAVIETPTGAIPLSTSASVQARSPQWRELLVTNKSPSTNLQLPKSGPPQPEFDLSLRSTPSSMTMPSTSQRYQALLPQSGSTIEICPEGHHVAADFARRIGNGGDAAAKGAALILDYGPSTTVPISTLRGIQAHQRTPSPFVQPGQVDLSADVDFTALAEAALQASERVEVHGPVEQGVWLERMGIRERAKMLSKHATNEQAAQRTNGAVDRLVDRSTAGGMGRIYKAMAIVPERGGARPVGFGGDIS